MPYREATMQIAFGHYLKANWNETAAFELKLCKDKRFPLSHIAPHQIGNLKLSKHGTLYTKISDSSEGQKIYDCLTISKSPAYVVLMFYKPRQPKIAYMLDVDDVAALIDKGTKSITEAEANQMAKHSVMLK